MSFHVDRFVGNVTNVPEVKLIGQKNTPLKELTLAANARRKNKETQQYEPVLDKNGKQKASWLTVKLWGERANEDFVKGDLVEFAGSVQEEFFSRNDGSEGRRLESDYVESVTIKWPSKDREGTPQQSAPATGFPTSVQPDSALQAAVATSKGF